MEASEYLLEIPMWSRRKNSLNDIRCFLDALGGPDYTMRVIHVAGSNGKGSVCAFLSSALREAGYRTGMFISPHLRDIRERIMLDGQMVSPEAFQTAFDTVYALTIEMTGQGFCHPTYFEFLFYMAMTVFGREKPDYVILETGMGGRLDVTNVIRKPLVCIITSISLEHTEYLGNTLQEIAGEKAGIIKPGVPVIFDAASSEALAVIENRARQLQSLACPVRMDQWSVSADQPLDQAVCRIHVYPLANGIWCEMESLELDIPSAAPYQQMNAMLAVRALELAGPKGLSFYSVQKGIRSMYWPGRMELARHGVYLDGAHNPDGIRAAADGIRMALSCQRDRGPLILLFASVKDKDCGEMARILCRLKPYKIVVSCMHNDRSQNPDALVKMFAQYAQCPVYGFSDLREALETALQAKGRDGMLFCLGSLYLIGELKEILDKENEGCD